VCVRGARERESVCVRGARERVCVCERKRERGGVVSVYFCLLLGIIETGSKSSVRKLHLKFFPITENGRENLPFV